jgi:hypothetical protein
LGRAEFWCRTSSEIPRQLQSGACDRKHALIVNWFNEAFVTQPLKRIAIFQSALQIGGATYARDGNDLQARGLYLDVPPWTASVFSLER